MEIQSWEREGKRRSSTHLPYFRQKAGRPPPLEWPQWERRSSLPPSQERMTLILEMLLFGLSCHRPCTRCWEMRVFAHISVGAFWLQKWASTWVSAGRGSLHGGRLQGGHLALPHSGPRSRQARCSGLPSHASSWQTRLQSCAMDTAPRGSSSSSAGTSAAPSNHRGSHSSPSRRPNPGMESHQPGFSRGDSPRQTLPWHWEV